MEKFVFLTFSNPKSRQMRKLNIAILENIATQQFCRIISVHTSVTWRTWFVYDYLRCLLLLTRTEFIFSDLWNFGFYSEILRILWTSSFVKFIIESYPIMSESTKFIRWHWGIYCEVVFCPIFIRFFLAGKLWISAFTCKKQKCSILFRTHFTNNWVPKTLFFEKNS